MRPSRQASECNVFTITTEVFNIMVDPFESCSLVPESVVAGKIVRILLAQRFVS